jgi:hypothetical protein
VLIRNSCLICTKLHRLGSPGCKLVQIPQLGIAPECTILHQNALNCTVFASKSFLHRKKPLFPMTIGHQGESSQIKVPGSASATTYRDHDSRSEHQPLGETDLWRPWEGSPTVFYWASLSWRAWEAKSASFRGLTFRALRFRFPNLSEP